MGDTFQCVKCGAKYSRERRRVGRAVVCSCGHKFLVPPPEAGPQPRQPSFARPTDGRRPSLPTAVAAADDSSAELLPLAELVDEGAPPERWAEPVAAQEPLPEAEIVYASRVEPARPGNDTSAAGGAYANPAAAPRRAMPRVPTTARARPAPEDDERTSNIAYIVLFTALPIFVLLLVLGVVFYNRSDRAAPPDPSQIAPEQTALEGGPQDTPAEPATSGLPVLVMQVTKKPTSDDFTMEYEVRHGALNGGSQYIWVVSSPQGKIEFQIPTPAPGRGHISGRPAQRSGLSPPFTAYIEAQSAGGRRRVSNEVPVTIGG